MSNKNVSYPSSVMITYIPPVDDVFPDILSLLRKNIQQRSRFIVENENYIFEYQENPYGVYVGISVATNIGDVCNVKNTNTMMIRVSNGWQKLTNSYSPPSQTISYGIDYSRPPGAEIVAKCDCGGEKCKLPCLDWCSARKNI